MNPSPSRVKFVPKRLSRTLVALTLAVSMVALQLVVLPVSQVSADTPFTPVFSTNAPGDIVYVANTLVTCRAGSNNCANAQAGGNFANNQFGGNNVEVDTDGVGATSNSSQATYALPAGGQVLWAGLYWMGYYQGSAADKDDVLFQTPATGGYVPVAASFFDDWNNNDDFYMGHADVTALVQAGGSGTYGVGDVAITPNTGNTHGGWSLVIIQEDPNATWKNLTVNQGFQGVTRNNPQVDITVSGFNAPPVGPVVAEIGMIASEGDAPYQGDYVEFNGQRLTNGLNPTNNFFNSTISTNGVLANNGTPGLSANTLGFDADIIDTNGLVPPGATSANIRLGTGGEWFYPAVVTTAIEIYVPNLSTNLRKTGVDLDGEELHPGDEIEYTIVFDNTGQDPAIQTTMSDNIPAGTTYVPGSLEVVSDDSGAGPRTDAAGDDTAWFDGTAVNFNIGAGATPTSGGQVDPVSQGGGVYEVKFRVTVDPGTETTDITNVASIDYVGQFIGDSYTATTPPVDIPVEPLVDLSVAKTDNVDPVIAGNDVAYTVSVSNAGPSDAVNATVTDTLPTGLTFTPSGSDPRCSAAGQVVTCVIPTLGIATEDVVINSTVDGEVVAASVTNSATVTSDTHEHDVTNNTTNEPTAIIREVDTSVTKSAAPTVTAGGQLTYTIDVANAGPSTALNTTVVDALPAGVVLVSATPTGAGTCAGTTCTWPTIAAAGSESVTIIVDVPGDTADATVLTNSVEVSSDDPDADSSDNTASVNTTVGVAADLALTKTLAGPIVPGEQAIYTLTVENLGPSDANAVEVTDAVPAGMTFSAAAPTSPDCNEAAGVVTCDGGTLASGDTATFLVVFDVDPSMADGTPVTNNASTSSSTPDPNAANDTASVTESAARAADVFVVKDDNTTTVSAGGQITYTFDYGNNGPSDATGVTISDTLPAGVTFASSTDCTEAGGVVTCNIGTLAPGATGTATFVVDVDPGLSDPTVLANAATISAAEADPTPTNNDSDVTTDVNRNTTLNVEKDDFADPVTAGLDVTYTLTVTNLGPSTETNATLTDPLPTGLTLVSVSNPACTPSGNTVNCNIGTMAPGAVFTTNVTASVDPALPDGTILRNQVIADGDVSAPVDDTEETTASARADLSVAKTAPATVLAGTALTYTIDVANAGPSDAKDTMITDVLPNGMTFASAAVTAGSGTCAEAGGVVTCDLGDVGPSTTTTIEITVDVDPSVADSTTLTNSATASTTTIDTDPSNDTGSAPVLVNAEADLATTKTTLTPNVIAGEQASFEVTVTNNGPSTATNVTATDTLPAEFVFDATASTAGCVAGVTCTAGTLLPGQSATFTIVVDVVGTAPANTYTNSVTAASDQLDPTPGNNDATSTIDVEQQADLQVVKIADAATFVPGTTQSYTITVTNNGPSTAANVEVTDLLPAGLTFNGTSSSECVSGVTCSVVSLASGADAVFTLVVDVAEDLTGSVTNTADVSSTTPDPTPGNNSSTDVTPLLPMADLSIVKTGPATALAGNQVSYTIDIANAGPSTATNVVVSDTLPAGMTFAAGSSAACVAGVTCTIPSMASGGTASLTVVVDIDPTVADATLLTNDAAITSDAADPDPSNNGSSVDTLVSRAADLGIVKTAPASASPGESVTYDIVVTNAGPSIATNVIIADTMPTGVTATAVAGTGALCASSGTAFSCSAGSLAPGGTITVTVTALIDPAAPDGATLTNTATVSADEDDPNAANDSNSAPIVLAGAADVVMTKTSSPATPIAGDQITYTLLVENNGPADAQDVAVADVLPSTLTIISATPSPLPPAPPAPPFPAVAPPPSTTTAMTCTVASQAVDCTQTTLAAGESVTVTIVAEIDSTLPANTDIINTASVSSATADPDTSNNTEGDTATIGASADLATTKTTPKTPAVAGEFHPFVVNVTNNGPSLATNVVVTDSVPPGTTFNATLSDASCTETAGVVTCNVGDLPDQGSVDVAIVFDLPVNFADGGTLANTASSSADQPDPDATNNDGTASVPVDNSADLSVVKDGNGAAEAGSPYTWTIDLENNGPSDALNVVVTDTLPAGVTFNAGASDPRCVAAGAVVTCTIGTLGAVSTDQLVMTVDVDPAVAATTDLTNTTTISSSTDDPNPTNNTSSDTATVSRDSLLNISKSDVADPVVAGEQVAWEILVENLGPSDAANVVITDVLPAEVTFALVDNANCTETAGTVDCAFATLALGDSITVTITADVNSDVADGAVISNTATTSSDSSAPVSDTETTTSQRESDLVISKVSDGDAVAGTQHTYTIDVTNNGPSDADNVTITDVLPAGFVFASATESSCTAAGPIVTCTPGTVIAGDTFTFELTVDVLDTAATPSQNNVTVGSDSADPDPTNDNDVDDTTVRAEADLVTVKRLTNAPLVPGTQAIWEIEVTNNGPSEAPGVTVTDALDPALTFDPTASSASCTAAGQDVTCAEALLTNGQSIVFTVATLVNPTFTGTLTNTASASSTVPDPDPSNNDATIDVEAAPQADLSLAKTGLTADVIAGEPVAFELVAANAGASDAVNVVVSDDVPAGLTYDPATSSPECVLTATGTIECAAGTIAPLADATFTVGFIVDADVAAGAVILNTASIASDTPDPDTTNNGADATVPAGRAVALVLEKTLDVESLTPGVASTWTLAVTNNGPSSADNVVVSDSLPPELTFVADGSDPRCSAAGSLVECVEPILAVGATATFDIVTMVGTDVSLGEITNAATASSDEGASADAELTVPLVANDAALRIEKTGPAAPVSVGENITWTIVLTNDGPNDVTVPITISDPLPAGLTYVSLSEDGPAECTAANNEISCDVDGLANGASITLTLVTTADVAGQVTNTVSFGALGLTEGREFSAAAGAVVQAPPSGPLAFTGRTLSQTLLFALLLMGAGFMILGAGNRREEDEAQA